MPDDPPEVPRGPWEGSGPCAYAISQPLLALVLAGTWVEAADGPVPPAEPARELLQPPTAEIPSPITDRFALPWQFLVRQGFNRGPLRSARRACWARHFFAENAARPQ